MKERGSGKGKLDGFLFFSFMKRKFKK